jgi:orotidine-5'-phosphate decarboxylase
MLEDRQGNVKSLLCVGLDPLPEKVPECIVAPTAWRRVFIHMREVVDATADYASMFKPQSAYYEALGPDGRIVLQLMVDYIRDNYPSIPIFLDCKRGDIDRTQERYAFAHQVQDDVDGMNFSPYMGNDCMKQLIVKGHEGAGIVGLGRTSNKAAWQIQDAPLAVEGFGRVWEYVVHCIREWAAGFGILSDAGIVMGAAHPAEWLKECVHYGGHPDHFFQGIHSSHLEMARSIVGNNLWFLIPGVGKQGGAVKQTVQTTFRGYGSVAINSSSGIIFAGSGPDFQNAVAEEAKRTRDEMNAALEI